MNDKQKLDPELIAKIEAIGKKKPEQKENIPPAPVKPKPETDDKLSISKDDFDTLLAMAKQGEDKLMQKEPTLGEQIERNKQQQVQVVQEVQAPIDYKPMDYGGLLSRPTVLYFDTDRTCRLVQPKINPDGSVQIDGRLFDFAEGQPSIISLGKTGKEKTNPFYIVKYDNMKPLDLTIMPESVPTPEQATRLVELRTLETLSKIEGGALKKGPLVILVAISIVVGFMAGYVLNVFGVI